MSIQTQIERLTDAKAALKTAIEQKGVAVPEGAPLEQYAPLVEQIVGSGGAGFRIIQDMTLEEESNAVLINKDTKGQPFELSEFYVAIISKKTASNAKDFTGFVCINSEGGPSYYSLQISGSDGVTGLFRKDYDASFFLHAIYLGWGWASDHTIRNTVNGNSVTLKGLWGQESNINVNKPAKSILIGDTSAREDGYFGIGTQIKIWGR